MEEKLLKFAQAYFLDNPNRHVSIVAIILPIGLLFCFLERLFLKFVSIFKKK